MDMSTTASREFVGVSARARVEELLKKYPDLSTDETAEILHFLKHASALEAALITTDEDLQRRLTMFRADHAPAFSLGLKHYLAVAALVAILIIGGLFLWDAGVK